MKPYRMHLMLCAGTGCVSNKSFHIAEVFEKELLCTRAGPGGQAG
jgi:hypothetical protein